jgi:hypothetical protein
VDLIVIFMMVFGSPTSALAQVWTDPLDYPPGSTVTIHGDNSDADPDHNWLGGEHIVVDVMGPNGYTAQCEADADAEGIWACDIVLWDSLLAEGEYIYTASGATSGNVESGMFTDAAGSTNKVYQHWADQVDQPGGPSWQGDILSSGKSDYFEGEVIPHVFDYKASNQTPLTNGQTYSFNVTYNYFQSNTNAGGFAYMTTYNISRQPGPNDATNPYIAPTADATFVNNGGMHTSGVFYTVDADITNVSAVTYSGSGSVDGKVTVTFTYTGETTTNGLAEIYFGLYIANPGQVTDQGTAPTKGASAWSGGSLQTTVDIGGSGATSIQLNPAAIIAGHISGVKFSDANSNGIKDAGELLLSGWTIVLDTDSNAANGNLQTTTTDFNGAYSFSVTPDADKSDPDNDPYYVYEVQQSPWTQTAPSAGYYGPLTISALTPQYINQDFGNREFIPAPALTVDKSSTTTGLSAPGTVSYGYVVTNTGNVALTGISLSDDNDNDDMFCPATTLAVGAHMDCTATHTFTQAELDANGSPTADSGTLDNTVTASSDQAPDATDALSIPITQDAAMTVDKSSTTTSLSAPGTVTYTYVVTNTGNIGLTGISLSDDNDNNDMSCPATTLAVGAHMDCTATHTVTQAELDANGSPTAGSGILQNIVTASSNEAPDATDFLDIPLVVDGHMTVEKSSTTASLSAPATVTYDYVVTNTGNLTLTNIVLSDNNDNDDMDCPATTLAVGAHMDCTATHTFTQAELDANGSPDAGSTILFNVVSASSDQTADVTDSLEIPIDQSPAIQVDKSSTTTEISAAGQVVPYTFVVTNVGNMTLTGITVTDPNCDAAPSYVSGDLNSDTNLQLAESWTYGCSHTVTQAELDANGGGDGDLDNTVTADSTESAPDTDDLSILIAQTPAIQVEKSSTTTSIIAAGQVVPYTFVVTNIGNVTLTGITVTDPNCDAAPVYVSGDLNTDGMLELAETWTYSCSHTVTQTEIDGGGNLSNTVTADSNESGPDTDNLNIPISQSPVIQVVKSSTTTEITAAGQVVPYSFVVTNLGNMTLTGITVSDPNCDAAPTYVSGDLNTDSKLQLAEGWTYTCDHTVTQAEVDAGGNLSNTVTADSNESAPDTDALNIPITQTPAIHVAKSSTTTSIATAGQVVPYTFVVTNPGNVTLTGITVTDPNCSAAPAYVSGDLNTDSMLQTSESWTYTCNHTVTQAEIDAGGNLSNTVTADSDQSAPDTDDLDIPINQNPLISLAKSGTFGAGADGFANVGELISYSFLVTNEGNVTLNNITVTDPKVSSISCPATFLAVGTHMTCTGTYAVTQADIDAGSVYNLATADSNESPSDDDDNDEPLPQNPHVTLLKSSTFNDENEDGYAQVGETISYSFEVTNDGNVTLSGITVTDTKVDPITCPATTLAVGTSMTCTGSYTVTQADIDAGKVDNTALAAGKGPQDQPVSDEDDDTETLPQNPHITLSKATTTSSYDAVGQVINYSLVALNDGNVTLHDVNITDPKLGALSCSLPAPVTLAPGASLSCTGSHTVTQADLDAGNYENTGTANGKGPQDQPVSDTDSANVPAIQQPGIYIQKLTNGDDGLDILVGGAITWTYKVTNTGNVTLTNVTVTDNEPVNIDCDGGSNTGTDHIIASLAPAAWVTCSATGTAVVGLYENTGAVSGTPPVGTNVTDNDGSSYFGANPQIAIVKVTNGSDGPTIITGSTVTWKYTVTNVGNVPLGSVTVTDNQSGVTPGYVSGDTNTDGIFDLTETWIYEATGTAIVGSYSNIGTAAGSFTDDEDVTGTDSETDASNYTGKVQVNVTKTVNGAAFSGPDLTFQLRQGAAPVTGQFGTVLDTQIANVANNGEVTFDTLLTVGTYQLCEYVPAGYVPSYIWGTYGVDWFKPGYAPNQGGLDPLILVCVNFTVNADGTINFQNGQQTVQPGGSITIDNQVGQMPLTIGFWKNHSSASGSNGGQDPVLDQMLYELTQSGNTLQIGTLLLPGGSTPDNAGTSATYAVKLLNKSTITGSKKMASDPCFNLAAQLVAYRLNQPNGAWPSTVAAQAADLAQQMLLAEGFNGNTHARLTRQGIANLNYLAKVLDAYNNSTLSITTLAVPYPGVLK